MQKISSYLYPNRIELLADLAGFTTEYTNVYQKIVKIYKGVDNVLEFDIKNADQKRIELNVSPSITNITLNVMDASGYAVGTYQVAPTTTKGIASVTIPAADVAGLDAQFLKYSVTATKDSANIPLYGDSRFGAVGTIELIGSAVPVTPKERVYSSFTAEIDLKGYPTYHSSAIPAKFYQAINTPALSFSAELRGFTGSIWVEATKATTISVESFKQATYLNSYTFADFTGNWMAENVSVGDYQYFRVSYTQPRANGIGASFEVTLNNNHYDVTIRSGGTGYAVGSQIKVLGSVIGGTDGVNDLIITASTVDAASSGYISSYAVSSITGITTSGTAADGVGTYIVTGDNITGTVEKITVYSGDIPC